MKEIENNIIQNEQSDQMCPMIEKPFKECYCVNMTSLNVLNVITYCGTGAFRECKVFQNEIDP